MTRISTCATAAFIAGLFGTTALPAYAEGPTPYQRLTNPEPQNWLLPHRTYDGWRFSPLTEITPANVKNLKLAFAFSMGTPLAPAPRGYGGQESQAMVDEGFLYVTNPLSMVFKLDVRSGTRAVPVWSYDPQPDPIGLANRGVALLGDRAFINTPDGRVIALKRETGEAIWEKTLGKGGEGFTGQPLIVKDQLMVGQSKGDGLMRGWVAAVDTQSGNERWRFHTIPGPGEPGHETWPANTDAWKMGGASLWTTPSYDVAANTIYIGTSNAAPAYDPEARPGDNLYTSSTIAVNADSGKMQWYFQYQSNEGMERDEVSPNILIDTNIGGAARKVLAHHSTRNGFFYVFDRTNGAFLIGEKNAPSVNWTAGLDPKTGKPVEYDPSKVLQAYGGVNPNRRDFGRPGCQSASLWQGQAYNPDLNRIYSLIVDTCFDRMATPMPQQGWVLGGGGATTSKNRPSPNPALDALNAKLLGPRVTATDVSTGKMVASAPADFPNPEGGTLTTKSGLVFFGHGDGTLAAYDARTMDKLWAVNVSTPLRSGVMTYAVNGKQYIAVTGGGQSAGVLSDIGNTAMLWVFAL